MTNNAGNTDWANKGAANKDGADITLEAVTLDGTINGLFTDNVWTTENGRLPGLFGNTVVLPPHLGGPPVSVLTRDDRTVPQTPPPTDAAVIAPVSQLTAEFTAGPNPVAKSAGIVKFYRQGKSVGNATLSIYDASGNFINKVKITDKSAFGQVRRQVGLWDLRDSRGRLVGEGVYLVKGVLKPSGGQTEKVSVILGVR